jgi:hypothetical protein
MRVECGQKGDNLHKLRREVEVVLFEAYICMALAVSVIHTALAVQEIVRVCG